MKTVPWRVVVMSVVCVGVCSVQAATSSSAGYDGLERRDSKGFDTLYVRPNVEFGPYKKVMIDPVEVEFLKSWERDTLRGSSRDLSRRVSSSDLQEIKTKLAAMVRDRFSKELTQAGYTIAATPDDDTLRLTPSIIDLKINAPDTNSTARVKTYTTEAGSMTLVMEAHDSSTGQILARVTDRQEPSNPGYMQFTNGATNRANAQRVIDGWAKSLRQGLDRLNGKGG
jgi:Protein of unknown function (DUF3313)